MKVVSAVDTIFKVSDEVERHPRSGRPLDPQIAERERTIESLGEPLDISLRKRGWTPLEQNNIVNKRPLYYKHINTRGHHEFHIISASKNRSDSIYPIGHTNYESWTGTRPIHVTYGALDDLDHLDSYMENHGGRYLIDRFWPRYIDSQGHNKLLVQGWIPRELSSDTMGPSYTKKIGHWTHHLDPSVYNSYEEGQDYPSLKVQWDHSIGRETDRLHYPIWFGKIDTKSKSRDLSQILSDIRSEQRRGIYDNPSVPLDYELL